ncbi:35856_t:CDS:10 [Gigaspora margarita]|uniref:35856_t:CDS:1 n=1 Tax=Gigaspora margarita TaxID=4874 RepID=A0ABN7UM85_GIGMA|nr:35856_t:CDS:10 [Gigaspora margarita]
MTDITEFENNFDDLLHKPASNNISETLSNVDLSNPFHDAVSLLIAPVSPLSDSDKGITDLYNEPTQNNLLKDSLIFEPEVQSIEIKFDEERDFEEEVSSFKGIDAVSSISPESHVHEKISNSDESLDDESIIIRESHVQTRITSFSLNSSQVGESIPIFEIAVEDPQKIGDPINAHIIYKVRTKTTSTAFKDKEFTVLRRYRDFLWLYNHLTLSHPGVIVPPIPGKLVIGRFQDEFVENRRQALEKCLNKIMSHPKLCSDPNLKLFLESDTFTIDVKRKNQDESKSVLKSLGEVVSNATTFSKVVETDEWVESRKIELDILDSQLRALLKSVEAIVKQRKDLGSTIVDFGDSILSLADTEINKPLANNLRILGNLQQKIKELHEKQAQQNVINLENTIDEYIRLIGSIKIVFNSRSKIYQTWQNAIYDLQKKKTNYERSKVQGRMSQDKLSIMLAQIADSEHRVEDCKHEFEDVSKLIKTELDRFDKEKVEDFKNSVEAFLESMVQTQKEIINLWESYSVEVELLQNINSEDYSTLLDDVKKQPIKYQVVRTLTITFIIILCSVAEESIDLKMNPFPHIIYQQNGSPNGPVSPVHSPAHTPSPPATSPGQTSPSLGYLAPHVPAIYGGSMHLFTYQSKLPSMGHAFNPHSLLNQTTGSPGQTLMSPPSFASTQPQLNISLSPGVTNILTTNNLGAVNTTHWQQQLNYAQLSRQSATPHHHARQAAAAARNSSLGSSAIAITDPNNPNKPPVNGVLSKKETNGDKHDLPFQQWMTIDLGGMGLKNISKELFQYGFLTTLYINHNNLTYISPEISKLRHLNLLDISGNKLSSIPSELGMLTNLRDLLMFDNMIVNLPFELGTLYHLETLGLEGNPINDAIKSILQKEGTGAVVSFLRENCQVPPPPMEREWITLDNEPAGGDRGMSPVTGHWLSTMVDTSQYEEYFKDVYSKFGDYDSVYWPKSRAKTMTDVERKSVDGCATFFKSSKYKLIDKQLIEFNQVALQRPDIKKTEDMFNRVITKDNIAVVTLLENKDNFSRLIIVNCHIHWDPSYADVKLVQVAMLMDELDKLAQKWCDIPSKSIYNYSSPQKISTIICGDFNSTPDSGVYEFLSRGTIKQDHCDFGDHIYGSYVSEGLSHRLSLKSAYSNIEELPFTNFTPRFAGVIDYIWYSTNTLCVTGLLGGVDKEYMSKIVGFPNAHFSSDHIVILAEFRVKPPQQIQPPPQFSGLSSGSNSNSSQRRLNTQLGSKK